MAPRIPALHVGQGTYVGGLTLFPVWVSAPSATGVEVGARLPVLDVAEREGSPVVGELVVTNGGPRPVALLEGDMLEGGWQDRTLVRSVLLAPGERRVVEVCCVEQGRWSGVTSHGHSVGRVTASVVGSLRTGAQDRQGGVWERVGRFEGAVGRSATHALRDHLNTVHRDPRLAALRPVEGQRGVVVGAMGTPIALEVFDSHATLVERWDALLGAAALDARLGPQVRTTGAAARRFTERIQRTVLRREAEGPGARVTSDRPGVSVRGLRHDHSWLHLSALSTTHPVLVGA